MVEEKEKKTLSKMIKAKDFLVEEYFKSVDKIIIPIYQRSYSWEDKNMEAFIKDIYNNTDYYIGNIMTIPRGKSIELIDGQQRIISIFLILCCLKNNFIDDYDFSLLNNGEKIEIETRASSKDSRLLQFIYNNDIPENYQKNKEVKEYKKAKRIITDNHYSPEKLLNKILRVFIVEIKFTNAETDAHNMFVNLNTKGKSLENVDILKSQLFKYLAYDESKGIEYYKEGWYQTINNIGEKNAQRYFENFNDIFLENINKNNNKLDNVLNYISSVEKAKEYYNEFRYESDEINGLCRCAVSVYHHTIISLNNISDGNFSLQTLDFYLKLFDKAKFKQFDVVLIPLLHIRNLYERKKFINNYNLITKFIKFILMHQEIMAINKASPSQYGNDFKKVGREIYLYKDYKTSIKKFLTENLNIHTNGRIKETIENLEINHDNTKHAKQIILLLEDKGNVDMTIDHFIPYDEKNNISSKIGNCIPVNKDEYGDMKEKEKLKKYKNNAAQEPYIRDFLQLGINENNINEAIEKRTNKIIDDYVLMYDELYKELTE